MVKGFLFFFFQAEDGIRDVAVTGVQTCALPILFCYSRRPGTPAADMADQVPDEVKASRNTRLLEVVNRVTAERNRRLAGRTLEVLVDGTSRKSAGELSGRTRCNRVVNFDGQGRVAVGDLTWVRGTEGLPHSLRGGLARRAEEGGCLSE